MTFPGRLLVRHPGVRYDSTSFPPFRTLQLPCNTGNLESVVQAPEILVVDLTLLGHNHGDGYVEKRASLRFVGVVPGNLQEYTRRPRKL